MVCRALKVEEIEAFKAYCRKYRAGLDDSFLYDEDLEAFQLDVSNPTSVLVSSDGHIVGVSSLIIQDYIDGKKRGRIRILHCESMDQADFERLSDAIVKSAGGLDHIYSFVDESNRFHLETLKTLGYNADRYAWVLTRPELPVEKPVFPEGYALRDFSYEQDEWAYLKVRNAAFANIKGSETPQTLESLKAFRSESTHMDGGIQLLWKGEEPVGLIRIFKETEDGVDYAFVAPIAIAPAYHGKGLGRLMLRAGLYFGQQHGMKKAMLSVNAENDKATSLYLQEGFEKAQVMVCLRLQIEQ